MTKHAVIYVFGLGDYRGRGQTWVIRWWRLRGVTPSVFRMDWRVPGRFDAKISRLLTHIDELAAQGYIVSLVGTSAGAGAVMNAYARRPDGIHRVVCICGKLRHPETIHPQTFARNPAFAESLRLLPASLAVLSPAKRARVLSLRPLKDGIVPPADTYIEAAEVGRIPGFGHVFSIAFAITFMAGRIIRFIKRP